MPALKFSLVTISFNQQQFLESAIISVVNQRYDNLEYIVVDPGSTDGSRSIIERHRQEISRVIYEPDRGAADGLNRGFSYATGDIYCYLNSDDELEANALHDVAAEFAAHPDIDVVCGHAMVVDERGQLLRRVWSDPMHLTSLAYGASIYIQPSTFIRRDAFLRAGGFNVDNKSSWDGELIVALAQNGAKFRVMNKFLSKYRVHGESITGTGSLHEKMKQWDKRRFQMIMGRDWEKSDELIRLFWLFVRQLRNPRAFWERLMRGRVFRRMVTT